MDWKNLLKPIAKGLFGKQQPFKYEKPAQKIYSLEKMLKDLIYIPPENWYKYAFSRDNINGRFNDLQRIEWAKKSILCGHEYANKIIDEFNTREPEKLAKYLNLDVKYPVLPDNTDRVLFADFAQPNRVQIFMDAIYRANRLLEREKVKKILGDVNIKNLILSHEIFHFLEDKYKSEIFTRTEKILLWSIGFIKNYSGIYALGEIAAMAFSQELNNLNYSPYVLDVFLIYDYSHEEASGLYEEILNLTA